MIKQVKDLKPGNKLYILDGHKILIASILGVRKFSEDRFKINWGFDDMSVVPKDCTSFSYGDKIVFLNKKNVISWLKGIQEEIK